MSSEHFNEVTEYDSPVYGRYRDAVQHQVEIEDQLETSETSTAGLLGWYVRPGMRTVRVVTVQESEWRSPVNLEVSEVAALFKRLRSRDVTLLTLLGQHRYLTTEQIVGLLYPSRAGLRIAQHRLRWLTQSRLVVRWGQLQPVGRSLRRLSSVFLLSQRGAAVLADLQGSDRSPLIQRSAQAFRQALRMDHDLEVNQFLIALASAAARIPGHGLYQWISDDSIRRNYKEHGGDVAPDSWGRYVMPEGEITFALEWDRGSERPLLMTRKAKAYLAFHGAQRRRESVLFVMPSSAREHSVRTALLQAGTTEPFVRVWTTHVDMLAQHGPLGDVWRPIAGGSSRERLVALPRVARSPRDVAHSLGRPDWWHHRPSAGEGA